MSDSDSASESELELTSDSSECESENDFESEDDLPSKPSKSSKKRNVIEPDVVRHTRNIAQVAKKPKPDSVVKKLSTAGTAGTRPPPAQVAAPARVPSSKSAPAPLTTVTSDSISSSSSSSSSLSSSIPPVIYDIAPAQLHVDCTSGPVIATDAAAKKLIITYLKQQNRPYSSIQIFENLHKRIQKPTVDKLLTILSDDSAGGVGSNEIICKEYGKAKIYYYNQHILEKSLESNTSLEDMDYDLKELTKSVDGVKTQHQRLKRYVEELQKQPTDVDLDAKFAAVEERVQAKRARVASISGQNVDINALDKWMKLHNKYRSNWTQRKSKCMDIVDMISDGMGKSLKHVCVEVGLETDEEAGEVLPKTLQESCKNSSYGGGRY